MVKKKQNEPELVEVTPIHNRRSLDPVQREGYMIDLAVDLAEKQLLEGTASPSVINHYLKLGTTREKLEREFLNERKSLSSAQVKKLEAEASVDEKYTQVIDALRGYAPKGDR
jgi:hypothetical protein